MACHQPPWVPDSPPPAAPCLTPARCGQCRHRYCMGGTRGPCGPGTSPSPWRESKSTGVRRQRQSLQTHPSFGSSQRQPLLSYAANPLGFISGDDGVGDTPATLPRGAAWRERSQDATLTPHEIPVTKMLHIWGASLWVPPPPGDNRILWGGALPSTRLEGHIWQIK